MSCELFAVFTWDKAADLAQKDLLQAGFAHDSITVERRFSCMGKEPLDGLSGNQSMVIVTLSNATEELKAIDIFDRRGATKMTTGAGCFDNKTTRSPGWRLGTAFDLV
jgi:hypothetical protein